MYTKKKLFFLFLQICKILKFALGKTFFARHITILRRIKKNFKSYRTENKSADNKGIKDWSAG
jgi:hypothetical protein